MNNESVAAVTSPQNSQPELPNQSINQPVSHTILPTSHVTPNLEHDMTFREPRWQYTYKPDYFRKVHWVDDTIDSPDSMVRQAHNSLIKFLSVVKADSSVAKCMQDFALTKAMSLIFFSNQIEDSGLNQNDTYLLLQKILGGTPPTSPHIMIPKLSNHVDYCTREVEQHAFAYRYLCIDSVNKPLTIDMIKETHRILMKDMILSNGAIINAGHYRTGPIFAGYHSFLPSDDVVLAMKCLVDTFLNESQSNLDWDHDQFDEFRDPYSLAAQLCHDFVSIHPFEDGNGRLCRLLMNYALMHYGIPFPSALLFGIHKRPKQKYLYSVRKDSRGDGPARWTAMNVLESVVHGWNNFDVVQASRHFDRDV